MGDDMQLHGDFRPKLPYRFDQSRYDDALPERMKMRLYFINQQNDTVLWSPSYQSAISKMFLPGPDHHIGKRDNTLDACGSMDNRNLPVRQFQGRDVTYIIGQPSRFTRFKKFRWRR